LEQSARSTSVGTRTSRTMQQLSIRQRRMRTVTSPHGSSRRHA
jgi:hypothetical protein